MSGDSSDVWGWITAVKHGIDKLENDGQFPDSMVRAGYFTATAFEGMLAGKMTNQDLYQMACFNLAYLSLHVGEDDYLNMIAKLSCQIEAYAPIVEDMLSFLKTKPETVPPGTQTH